MIEAENKISRPKTAQRNKTEIFSVIVFFLLLEIYVSGLPNHGKAIQFSEKPKIFVQGTLLFFWVDVSYNKNPQK